MRIAAAHNVVSATPQAVRAACDSIREQLQGAAPDLAMLFVTPDHAESPELAAAVTERLGSRHLLGCTGETVVGGGQELERGPALSLWAAHLPGVELTPFHITFEYTPDGLISSGLPGATNGGGPTAAIVLGDPFTCAIDSLLEGFADEYPALPLTGGMASGAREAGDNRLYLDDRTLDHGGVGMLIGPGVSLHPVVSQGCRPIGAPYLVTRGERNLLIELGGRPALERLQETFSSLDEGDRELFQQGPHIGLVINEYQDTFDRGDFLIANVIGADRERGVVAVGNHVRTGQTMQFHLRDADTADEDLRVLLGQALARCTQPPKGALLFSCNGRGTRMFPQPDHDAAVIQELAGPLPLAGLFAQGELGPVGGVNHVHGFTASVVLFGE